MNVVPAKAGTQVCEHTDCLKRSHCIEDLGSILRGNDVFQVTG